MSIEFTSRRWVDEHKHVHFTLERLGAGVFDVVLSRGCEGTSLRRLDGHPIGYFYGDEDEAVIRSWQMAVDERKATIAERRKAEALRRQTDTALAYGDWSVDLSCAETFDALSGCESRAQGDRVEVRFRGEWWCLSRTDLKDDVCTGGPYLTVDQHRDAAAYGARLKAYPHGRYFAVVDCFSDG